MKDSRPFLLIVVSVFLIVSLSLLAATIFLYIRRPAESTSIKAKTIFEQAGNTRDSLKKVYSAAVKELDTSFALPIAITGATPGSRPYPDSSANKDVDTARFEKLKNEISSILQNKSPDADLELAKMKIDELQGLVEILKNRNAQITRENIRLYSLLQELGTDENTDGAGATKSSTPENAISNKIVSQAANLKVENIQLTAMAGDPVEKETNNAGETEKLIGSLNIKGSSNSAVGEIMVVVLQPDGKVLQNSNWETGVFYAKDGKHIYSNKLRFDNTGEPKKLNFSLEAERYMPGKYKIEIYHNGLVVGRATKILS